MASTVTTGNLVVTISESIVLNGERQGGVTTKVIPSVNEIVKRIVTIPTTETGLLGLAAHTYSDLGLTHVAGVFDEDDARYIRITNLDDSNHVTLTFRSEGNAEFAVKLDAGHSFIYAGDNGGGMVDTMDASASALGTPSFEDLVDITALANSAACDIEVFVASI